MERALTKKGERMLEQSRQKHTAVDYVQSMMHWATNNLEKEEILEIINSADGKVVGLDKLQAEVMDLEEKLRIKRKELLKKTLALYFIKPDKKHANEGNLIEFSEFMNSFSRRDGGD